jgi:serine kinase of HPr protein (carbohydrate metabolism regulator)
MSETLHATCVAIGGRAVLIEGPSGAGKSDLALRLIDRGATLVSDDYTHCEAADSALLASPPTRIAGQIEVRGIGIVRMPHLTQMPVALIVTLLDAPPRMPDPATRRIDGIAIPLVALAAREPSAAIKVELALNHAWTEV